MRLAFDALVVVGRSADLKAMAWRNWASPRAGTVETNEFLQTNCPNVSPPATFAGPYTVYAAPRVGLVRGRRCAVRSVQEVPRRLSVIPWAHFVEPEAGAVGLNRSKRKNAHPYD